MNIPLLVIVGETAAGKSALALELAHELNGEIICADSWTVRREVNIGTDKPTQEDRRAVKHHLIDVAGPNEDFTAAIFKDLALNAIEEIYSRGKLPILVGGSGLYIDGVIFNYGFLKAGDRDLRQDLNVLSNEQLLDIIRDRGLDTFNIDTRNKRRLIRLIEVDGAMPSKDDLRPNTLVVGVKNDPEELKSRVIERVDKMIASGLEQEVREQVKKYGWGCEALKGVGYKQWREYLEGHQSLEETRTKIISATMNLAKKQRTWFKRNKSIHWYLQPIKTAEIVDLATTKLSTNHFN